MAENQNAPEELKREHRHRAILANAVELSSNTIRQITGNEVASGIDGQTISNQQMANVLASKIQSYLLNPTQE